MFLLLQMQPMDIPYGNDTNDGLTPQTPVRTMSKAYSKLDSSRHSVEQYYCSNGRLYR